MNSQKTILLIEDNAEMAEGISEILELENFRVIQAVNGKVGVELAFRHLPDLILCDVVMPVLDGYGVAHLLCNDEATSSIPFIFLTAKADKIDIRTGMNLGADDYLIKPFDAEELLQVVNNRLHKREAFIAETSKHHDPVDDCVLFDPEKEFSAMKELVDNRPVRKFRRRDLLFMSGQMPCEVFYVLEGKIKTYKSTFHGKELITGIYEPGQFIGFFSLLLDRSHQDQAVVMEDATLVVIPKEEFFRLLYSSKEILRRFIKLLSAQVIEADSRLLTCAYQSLRNRVAFALLSLHSNGASSGQHFIKIARSDLSDLVGTAKASVNRILGDFRDEGILKLAPQGLKILNKTKLQSMLSK